MLLELKIRNLAIIDSLEVNFGKGLNVITGETGAGKSVILAALNLVLGGRSDKELIRTGTEEASVEAIFEVNSPELLSLLTESGIEIDPGEPLILKRMVHVSGRSRGFINCTSAPAVLLKQITPFIIDFGRQHEQNLLMDPEKHMELVDRYAKAEEDRESVSKAHQKVVSLLKEQKKLLEEKGARAEREDFLNYQYSVVKDIDPQPNEEEELTQELEKLSNIASCRSLARKAESELYNMEHSVQGKLAGAINIVEELAEIDESLNHVVEDLHNALIAVEEAARSINSYQKTLHNNPQRMEEVQERLDQVIDLQNRYGGSFDSVMERLKEINKELKEIAAENQRLEKLGGLIHSAKNKLLKHALRLSQKRIKFSKELATILEKELADLAMENTQFVVDLSSVADEAGSVACGENEKEQKICAWGAENINFLLSANKGEELRPLEKVASGGELSRIMLAVKRIIGGAFAVPTLVFDEIDSGMSGNAATRVAHKLQQIVGEGEGVQIICISHTAQVAAKADNHFLVKKRTKEGRTSSLVFYMDHEQRIQEVSRMLADDQSKEQALALAQQLVKK